ncbi:putative pectinesterase 29 [Cinnamomum micranthum f. kanehirae]|uniref:pectinesterase n=1 Tax=Cinnamomum micranthum f. kanehirae TaxID=337451 RepID=A0A443PJS1_9MAGN|nr:putative pectinesterase 29 [Cinnamomum micranthum f. kanehirae]
MCWAGPSPFSKTINVDWTGHGDFTKLQDAINSVPINNQQWVLINLRPGSYREQVTVDRPFISLQGEGPDNTMVEYSSGGGIFICTFSVMADNFVAKRISFKGNVHLSLITPVLAYNFCSCYQNNYNSPLVEEDNPRKQAVAVRVRADKVAFYECQFIGVQDTLLDDSGRHFYHSCVIKGCVDFICGSGQSRFENCTLEVNGNEQHVTVGYITAQARAKPNDTNGFVFIHCTVSGSGKVYLGRPWGSNARVLFYQSYLGANVLPKAWDAWTHENQVADITFAESGCSGPGSNESKRVPWEKKLSDKELTMLTSMSFIDGAGWVEQLPL